MQSSGGWSLFPSLVERYALPGVLLYRGLIFAFFEKAPAIALAGLIPFLISSILLSFSHSAEYGRLSKKTTAGMVASFSSILLFELPLFDTGSMNLIACLANLLFYCLFLLWSLLTLGRSFGVIPAVRPIVTSGPYQLVRHPIYSGYLLAAATVTIATPGIHNIAAFLLLLLGLTLRSTEEEALLTKTSVEYRLLLYNVRNGFFNPILLIPLVVQILIKVLCG